MPTRVAAKRSLSKNGRALRPRLKVWVENEGGVVLGPFLVELLRAVGETGSLAEAAHRLGLSYRRAWGKLREMEQHLGAQLVIREKGGAHGGGSRLTPQAERMVARYRRLSKIMEGHLRKEFQGVFNG